MTKSGMALRLQRTAARVTVTDLAARVGVSRQTLTVWESSEVVPADKVERYEQALATFRDVTTELAAA